MTFLSLPQLAKYFPEGDQATLFTSFSCPSTTEIISNFPFLISQSVTWASKLARTTNFPHGDHATSLTVFWWEVSANFDSEVNDHFPLSDLNCQTLAILSSPHEINLSPFGFQSKDHPFPTWAGTTCTSFSTMISIKLMKINENQVINRNKVICS